jgi:hypothetical protein
MKHLRNGQWRIGLSCLVLALGVVGLPTVQAQEKKPNILVIMGDDIG